MRPRNVSAWVLPFAMVVACGGSDQTGGLSDGDDASVTLDASADASSNDAALIDDAAVNVDASASDATADVVDATVDASDAPTASDATDDANDAESDAADANSEAAVDAGCVDGDGDGYGTGACLGLDCNDADPLVNPAMLELADDGLDNDCSGADLKAATGPGVYVDRAAAACSDSVVGRGTKAKPYCSLEIAVVEAYQQTSGSDKVGKSVFVAKGDYPRVIGFPQSMRLYGGYDASSWSYDPVVNETVIGGAAIIEDSDSNTCRLGAGCASMTCACIDWEMWVSVNGSANAVIQGFTIKGGARAGKPLFAVMVNSSGRVVLAHNKISAGSGLETRGVSIAKTAGDVWLIQNRISAGTPSTSTAFGVTSLGTATLWGNVLDCGPGGAQSYAAGVQNYGVMRLAENVINSGDVGGLANATYGLINQTTTGTLGTVHAVNNVIFGGAGTQTSVGVLSNSPLTLVNNVLGDRASIPLDWSRRPANVAGSGAWGLSVGFASSTTLLNNMFVAMPYVGEPSPPNALAKRHLMVHSQASSTDLDTTTAIDSCSWTGCVGAASNITGDPGFVDASSDLHLTPASACVGMGTNATTYISGGLGYVDIDRTPRPQGVWDIGIDER